MPREDKDLGKKGSGDMTVREAGERVRELVEKGVEKGKEREQREDEEGQEPRYHSRR